MVFGKLTYRGKHNKLKLPEWVFWTMLFVGCALILTACVGGAIVGVQFFSK